MVRKKPRVQISPEAFTFLKNVALVIEQSFIGERLISPFSNKVCMVDVKRAEEIYAQICSKLKDQEGKIVAIDPASGDYFIGSDTLEACDLGRKRYPSRQFYLKRVGARTAFFVGAL